MTSKAPVLLLGVITLGACGGGTADGAAGSDATPDVSKTDSGVVDTSAVEHEHGDEVLETVPHVRVPRRPVRVEPRAVVVPGQSA